MICCCRRCQYSKVTVAKKQYTVHCYPAKAATCALVQTEDFGLNLIVTAFQPGWDIKNHHQECVLPKNDLPDGRCCFIGGRWHYVYIQVLVKALRKRYANSESVKYAHSMALKNSVGWEFIDPVGAQSGRIILSRPACSPSCATILQSASVPTFKLVNLALEPSSPNQGLLRLQEIMASQLLGLHQESSQETPCRKAHILVLCQLTPSVRYPSPLGQVFKFHERVPVVLLVTRIRGNGRRSAWSQSFAPHR
jgi:hypothetical protein